MTDFPKFLSFAVVALSASAIACSSGEPSASASEDAIRRLGESWSRAAEAGNVERLVALYKSDAVFLPPGAPAVEGRDAIAGLFREQFRRFRVDVSFETDEIVIDRRLAFRRGSYRARMVSRNSGDTLVARDKFVEIWRRGEDGRWRIARDIWNSLEGPGAED